MHKTKSFREKLECVIAGVSTFLIFMFVDQLLLVVVDVFSQLYYPTHAKK